ncbi:MAG: AmmeMemoRadiSam system protein A [Candidatus Heimdallarchaeota archaeon]|nr:AmmeMemoRadiSam system protein A [Candidatus Heimdallarchaeota archaeon]
MLEIALKAIEEIVINNVIWQPNLEEGKYVDFRKKQGAFTTLYTGPVESKKLRGCIGVPRPVYPLGKAIAHSAKSAAVGDPRFPRVKPEELSTLLTSVEILSPITEIIFSSREELETQIVIGQDGLILEAHHQSGLLLPKVPVEQDWDVDTYLKHMCRKAMLPETVFDQSDTKMYKFSSIVYTDF